jgi:hypothetical protein
MDEVSTRLLERDTEAAGKSTTVDLNLGVMDEEMITDAIKANNDSAIRIHFLLQVNLIKSKALLTTAG